MMQIAAMVDDYDEFFVVYGQIYLIIGQLNLVLKTLVLCGYCVVRSASWAIISRVADGMEIREF